MTFLSPIAHRQRIVNDNATLLLNLRDEWRRKKLKSERTKDLPSVQIQSESSSVSHNAAIHINESLAPYRKHLFSRILDLKKNHHFNYLWTSNGKIVLRESQTSTTHRQTPRPRIPIRDRTTNFTERRNQQNSIHPYLPSTKPCNQKGHSQKFQNSPEWPRNQTHTFPTTTHFIQTRQKPR